MQKEGKVDVIFETIEQRTKSDKNSSEVNSRQVQLHWKVKRKQIKASLIFSPGCLMI